MNGTKTKAPYVAWETTIRELIRGADINTPASFLPKTFSVGTRVHLTNGDDSVWVVWNGTEWMTLDDVG